MAEPKLQQCHSCGSNSADPHWCDVCGADLSPVVQSQRWLNKGDRVFVTLSQTVGSEETGEFVAIADQTQPGVEPVHPPELESDPFEGGNTQLFSPSLDSDADTMPPDIGGDRILGVTLDDRVSTFANRRVWIGTDDDEKKYRVEERRPQRQGLERDVPALGDLLDAPLGTTKHGENEVRVLAHVEGTLLAELMARPQTITPAELLQVLEPIIYALDSIHRAGYVCLRVSPYSVRLRTDGGVFFENVDRLFHDQTTLTSVPSVPGYSAPEIYAGRDATQLKGVRMDVYSVAMLAYALIAKTDPPITAATRYAPVVSARAFSTDFPLGFARFFDVAGSQHPQRRPSDMPALLDLLRSAVQTATLRTQTARAGIALSIASETHTGILKRQRNPVNQDAVFHASLLDSGATLLAVADGVSTASYGSGDLASGLAIARIRSAWTEVVEDPTLPANLGVSTWVERVIQEANQDIVSYVNQRFAPFDGEPHEVMGTTIVVAYIHKGRAVVSSLGDSRAYLIRPHTIERITRDHNLVTLGIVDGLPAETAVTLPQRDALARCLGTFEVGMDGHLHASVVRPDTYTFTLTEGDQLLLCTDGLTDYAGESPAAAEKEIHRIVAANRSPDMAALELILLANRGGGGDNVGVAVASAARMGLPGPPTGDVTVTVDDSI